MFSKSLSLRRFIPNSEKAHHSSNSTVPTIKEHFKSKKYSSSNKFKHRHPLPHTPSLFKPSTNSIGVAVIDIPPVHEAEDAESTIPSPKPTTKSISMPTIETPQVQKIEDAEAPILSPKPKDIYKYNFQQGWEDMAEEMQNWASKKNSTKSFSGHDAIEWLYSYLLKYPDQYSDANR
eukprot:Ihof_evm1s4 gene=Ihof_evmTU1s4